ncbi:MAG: hypothetical protein MJY93_03355 [Fibrobacter sp.]|nr:hypothetical protein [Fibrobacter sp.]
MFKEFIRIVGTPRKITSQEQANAELGRFKKAIGSINNLSPIMREYIAARCRIIREKYPRLREDIANIFQLLVETCVEGYKVHNADLFTGAKHSIEWWERESQRLFNILKPSKITTEKHQKRKGKVVRKPQEKKITLRTDIPIILITGITNKKEPIEQACGFEVKEVLVERWAPNLKKVDAICEGASKSTFGIFVCLCKNTCHAVAEVAQKYTKGASKWIVLKVFKNNSQIVAESIRKAILAAGFAI